MKALIRVDYTLNSDPLELYGQDGELALHKAMGESYRHLALKMVSYFLFFHPDLQIERSAQQHYKPDLLRVDAGGTPQQWIDCGTTSLKKLEKLERKNKQTLIDIVKATRQELWSYKLQADRRVQRPERVRYFAFEDGFIDALAECMQTRHRVVATVSGAMEHFYLDVDGQSFDSDVIQLHDTAEEREKGDISGPSS